VKANIAWFLIGFVVSWLTWSGAAFIRYRPRDYTQAWPEDLRELLPLGGMDWLKNARGYRIGSCRIFTPANRSDSSVQLQSLTIDGLPGIGVQDENADGTVDRLLVVDSAHRHFSFAAGNGTGVFDSYEYTTGIGPESKTFRDDDMDGQFNFRVGPGRSMAVFIESQWRDVVGKDNKHFVELEGKLVRIEFYPIVRIVDGN